MRNEELTMTKSELNKLIALENANFIELVKIVNAVIGDGSPKGVFPTVFALKSKYPNGAKGIYVVTADGHWYYWNGQWADGGVYQSDGLANGSVGYPILDQFLKDQIDKIDNLKADNIAYRGLVPSARDVQQALDATYKRVNTIIASSGTSSTEVVDARGGFPVLGDRLNNFDSQLDKIRKNIKVIEITEGVTEYSSIINEAFQNYSYVLVKNGYYPIDVSKVLPLKSNTEISWEPMAKIKVLPNNLDRYYLIDITDVENIILNNPNLEGDKYEHTGITGQWGHGINIIRSKNVKINAPNSNKFWGDGLYIRGGEEIIVTDGRFDDNRRQGISIISGKNIEIVRPICSNTSGHSPSSGIDIEPNSKGEHLINVNIYFPYLFNNGRGVNDAYDHGLTFALKQHYSETEDSIVDVNVYNPTIENCSLTIESRKGSSGTINIYNPIIKNSNDNGLLFIECDSDKLQINVENPKVFNPNRSGRAGVYSNGMSFEERASSVGTKHGLRNIKVTNPYFKNVGNPCKAITLIGFNSEFLTNCEIINPSIEGEFTVYLTRVHGGLRSPIAATFKYTFDERLKPLFLSPGSTITDNFERNTVAYNGSLSSGSSFYLAENIFPCDVLMMFENLSTNNKPLDLLFGSTATPTTKMVYPLTLTPINGIKLPTKYSWVKMKKISETEYVILSSSNNITTV